jgi:hypothetical protein
LEHHKKLYEEALVKEIMISTALCVQELIQDDSNISEEEICMFLEENYPSIIEETLTAEMDDEEDEESDSWKKER